MTNTREGNAMQKVIYSVIFTALCGSFAMGGGDIAPVVPVAEEYPAVDNNALYIGAGYAYFKQSNDDIVYRGVNKIELETDSILLQAGYQYNEYLAFEGRYWFGVGDISQSGGMKPGDRSGDYDAWALYVKPMYPVTEHLDVYALLGYAETDVEYDDGSFWDTEGFSWGVGAQYEVVENIVVFADYISLSTHDSFDIVAPNGAIVENVDADVDLYMVNVGISYRF